MPRLEPKFIRRSPSEKGTSADIPDYDVSGFQIAVRLKNGNTLVNNWLNMWNTTVDPANAPVQIFEFTPGKQLVWALRSWSPPNDLGPSTIVQLRDRENAAPAEYRFGDIR